MCCLKLTEEALTGWGCWLGGQVGGAGGEFLAQLNRTALCSDDFWYTFSLAEPQILEITIAMIPQK